MFQPDSGFSLQVKYFGTINFIPQGHLLRTKHSLNVKLVSSEEQILERPTLHSTAQVVWDVM